VKLTDEHFETLWKIGAFLHRPVKEAVDRETLCPRGQRAWDRGGSVAVALENFAYGRRLPQGQGGRSLATWTAALKPKLWEGFHDVARAATGVTDPNIATRMWAQHRQYEWLVTLAWWVYREERGLPL